MDDDNLLGLVSSNETPLFANTVAQRMRGYGHTSTARRSARMAAENALPQFAERRVQVDVAANAHLARVWHVVRTALGKARTKG